MKRATLASLILALTCLVSCVSPFQKNSKAEAKVDKAKQALDNNKAEQTEKAKGFVYAADFALSLDPNPSRFSEVGKNMTERSLLTLGQPDLEIALQYQRIVDGLVSTNAALQKKAKSELASKDREVESLQGDVVDLKKELGKAEEKRKVLAAENATMASKWARMMFWIRTVVYVVIGGFVLRIVAAVLPPPYNSIGYIIDFVFGGIGRCIFKLLPKAKDAAGVVAKEAYDISEKTLSSVVHGVQQARQNEDVRAVIDPILRDSTDKEIARPKIIEVKTQLGHI
jgi:hypothetical protein